jgi:hypothetical protein
MTVQCQEQTRRFRQVLLFRVNAPKWRLYLLEFASLHPSSLLIRPTVLCFEPVDFFHVEAMMNIKARKLVLLAAIILVLTLLSLWLLFGPLVPFLFVLAGGFCLLVELLFVWAARSGWRRPLASVLGFIALMVAWWHQPWFGANVCPTKGFMWETDFVEEMRPTLRFQVERYLRRVEEHERPDGLSVQGAIAVLDRAIDLFKQCVAARGLQYCRYVGPNEKGTIFMARTNEGPGAIAAEDEYKYRLVRKDVNYEMAIVPTDAGPSEFYFQMWQGGKTLGWRGDGWGTRICELGCFCDVEYGRR